MTFSTIDEKSFDPKLIPEGDPTSEWGIEQLGAYAQLQHRQILDGEKSLSPSYWRLGQALELALKNLPRGHRGKYLEQLKIDKVRASKARAIARTFEKVEEVRDLSVEEAYSQRRRKQRKGLNEDAPPDSARSKETGELRKFVGFVSTRAEALIDIAGFTEPADAKELLPPFREAVQRLVDLVRHLERQAEARSSNIAAETPDTDQESDAAESLPEVLNFHKKRVTIT
jgi:hypothetical protein